MPYPPKLDDQRIRTEAIRLIDEQGVAALSMRTLAARLGARAPSLYRHFPDKPALLRAVSAWFLLDLARELAEHDTVAGLGTAYLAYALRHPHRFEVMFRLAPEAERAPLAIRRQAAEPLLAVAARLNPGRPLPAARVLWSYLHGAATLRLADWTRAGLDLDDAFTLGLAALERGLTD